MKMALCSIKPEHPASNMNLERKVFYLIWIAQGLQMRQHAYTNEPHSEKTGVIMLVRKELFPN